MLTAGEPFGIAVTGPSDVNRVEAGILGYRCDMDMTTNPFEVGLERLVDLDAPGDFIGKAALTRIRDEGITRKLVGIEILGDPLPLPFEERWPVIAGGSHVGEVTVAVYSPRLRKNIGYAMVSIGHTALGTSLAIEAPWLGTARPSWPRSRSSSGRHSTGNALHPSLEYSEAAVSAAWLLASFQSSSETTIPRSS